MADCEKLAKCPFFTDQMTNMPSIAALMKQNYCQSDKTGAPDIAFHRQAWPFLRIFCRTTRSTRKSY